MTNVAQIVRNTINTAKAERRDGLRRNTHYLVQKGVFNIPSTGADLAVWLREIGFDVDQYGPRYAMTRCGVEVTTGGNVYYL